MTAVPFPTPDDLLDEKEAAVYLTVAVTTLRNWRSLKGKGPRFVKVGARLVRYRRADLAAFITGDAEKDAA